MKRTWAIKDARSALVYIAYLLSQGTEFSVKPWVNRVDITVIGLDDPKDWPRVEHRVVQA